jgi:hypothetical protein
MAHGAGWFAMDTACFASTLGYMMSVPFRAASWMADGYEPGQGTGFLPGEYFPGCE